MNKIMSHIKLTLLTITSCQIDKIMFKQLESSPKLNFENEMLRDHRVKNEKEGVDVYNYILMGCDCNGTWYETVLITARIFTEH